MLKATEEMMMKMKWCSVYHDKKRYEGIFTISVKIEESIF